MKENSKYYLRKNLATFVIISILIASNTLAATYTLPGGQESEDRSYSPGTAVSGYKILAEEDLNVETINLFNGVESNTRSC